MILVSMETVYGGRRPYHIAVVEHEAQRMTIVDREGSWMVPVGELESRIYKGVPDYLAQYLQEELKIHDPKAVQDRKRFSRG